VPTIQRSIEVNVPITRLYVQLIQFEDYPRFLDDVESVRQSDIRHLHWTAKTKSRTQEGDVELTEQEENRHIVWHDAHDRNNNGGIDMEELGPNLSRMRVTLNIGSGTQTREYTELRLDQALASLKEFLEERGPQFDAQRMALDNANTNGLDAQEQADMMNEVRQPSVCPAPENMSGSPTETLEDEPNESGVDAMIKSNAHIDAPSSRADQGRPAN
jgi:hypothetical protein